ncbi:MAG TPA: carboxypeptidase-like regulatory domain-containing protein [Candidatus Acidoferrum sp.]|jgi:hypothetical protein
MTAIWPRLLSLSLTGILAAAAHAGTLSGTVINRTTGKATANVDLTLLSPTQGMRELGSSKSDAEGHFSITNDAIGTAPVLVRATYHDVSYNTFAPPGRPNVEVEIYELSKDIKTVSIANHIIIFQPGNNKLIGAEEYVVRNGSQPPEAYFRTEGNFEFAIPEKAKLQQVSTVNATGMSVQQASIDKGKGHIAIAYPFRPGDTSIRLSYEMPYSASATSLKLTAVYPGVNTLVVVPPGVTVTGDGLTAAGQEQGMFLFAHEPLAAKGSFTVKLSGVAAPQAADAGAGEGQGAGQGGMPQEGNSRTQTQDVQAVPGRLSEFKWPLLVLLLAGFAGMAILLSRKTVVVVQGPGDEVEPPAATAGQKKSAKAKPAPAAARAPAENASSAPASAAVLAASVASVNAHVNSSLDTLKDEVFRLELRKQAGTISDEEYAREKTRVEKLLRDLVRG